MDRLYVYACSKLKLGCFEDIEAYGVVDSEAAYVHKEFQNTLRSSFSKSGTGYQNMCTMYMYVHDIVCLSEIVLKGDDTQGRLLSALHFMQIGL